MNETLQEEVPASLIEVTDKCETAMLELCGGY